MARKNLSSVSSDAKPTSGDVLGEQIIKATKALLAYEQKRLGIDREKDRKRTGTQLFDDGIDEHGQPKVPVWLVIGLDNIPEKIRHKPCILPLRHPWKSASDDLLSVCLITKDPQREFKDRINPLGIKSLTKIIGISKLRTKFKPYEAKRNLCASFDVFLADDRILPLLPPILGKTFFSKKKLPVPVNLTKKSPEALRTGLVAAIEATILPAALGPCLSIKAGLMNQKGEFLVENIKDIIEKVAETIPTGRDGIRSVHLKTGISVSLPVFVRKVESDRSDESHEQQ